MESSGKTLGILGGLGPMSSVYFYEMITSHTLAERDQDHINVLLSSRATRLTEPISFSVVPRTIPYTECAPRRKSLWERAQI